MRLLLAFAAAAILPAADPNCPRYPAAARTETQESIDLDREFQALSKGPRIRSAAASIRAAEARGIIDQLLFGKMAADGVAPAPRTTDTEFLRRIYLDLTGRIPTPEQAERFLNSSVENNREALVDELLASPAYADQFALFFNNKLKITRAHESVSTPGRDVFYAFLRDMVASDRSYDAWVRELLTAAGEVDTVPGTQFFTRWMDVAGPIQDSWDDITDKITTTFLGYKTECVSCHNGRAHLEKINLHLTTRTRREFWEMSAFLSRMAYVRWSDDPIGFRPRIILVDRDYGTYSGSVPPTNPGNRPARLGAVVTPRYFTSDAEPRSGEWRRDLADMVTRDRQFAKATVNHFWDYFFGHGIVDPPDAWDLNRVDPKMALPPDWPTQNSYPELLERLADSFAANQFRLRPLIRQIVLSQAYQLSARYEGQWRPGYVKYFARHETRRLSAEQLYDSMITATQTEQPMSLGSTGRVVRYANQLPDPTEPVTDFRVIDFLNALGRGNWLTIDRSSEPTILGLLYQMNDGQNVNRSLGASNANVGIRNRVHEVDAMGLSDEETIQRLFLATLTRRATDAEMALVLERRSGPRYQWLSDLQWALLNKLDFTFNY
ncbi:MAG: DUF1549 domain-containing protein [Acidobacteria bacterium]|nr:DUF1549 domain-containing protein [Acidobacteriota bacterium]